MANIGGSVKEGNGGDGTEMLVPPTNYSAQIADQVRDEVLRGLLQPGQKISIRSLTRRFGVSHIPIREAIRTLEAEGLITATGTKRYTVAKLETEDLRSLYELREFIEPRLAEMAPAKMSDAQIASVREHLVALEAAVPGTATYRDAHRAFHWSLIEPCRNQWVDRVLTHLWSSSERYIGHFVEYLARSGGNEEHREMAAACLARDGAELSRLTHQHLHRVEKGIEDSLRKMREQGD
jgi:DNA-binding GntR family transcriptional regulator